jgi:hypothetical protein
LSKDLQKRIVLLSSTALAAWTVTKLAGMFLDEPEERESQDDTYLLAAALQIGNYPAAAEVDRKPPVLDPVRDEDTWRDRLAGARNPGEKGSTCENRSPFEIPSERASEASDESARSCRAANLDRPDEPLH